MPVAATIFTNLDCSYQSARITANAIDPYDPEVYQYDDLYETGTVSWIPPFQMIGVSSVMLPPGYAMSFSNSRDYFAGKKEVIESKAPRKASNHQSGVC